MTDAGQQNPKPETPTSRGTERMGQLARVAFTLILLGLVAWWLVVVAGYLGTAPVKDPETKEVLVDPYQRSKDILLVVLPIVTIALGYWFGSQGKEKAEQRSQQAQESADQKVAEAQQKVAEADARTTALAANVNPQALEDARRAFPQAFAEWG